MKKTGQLLKDKREAASLSISEVALATKINPKILTAIELGEEKNLPAKTFLKGFLRSYALFLKMDADEVLRSYMEECGGPAVDNQRPPVAAEPAKTSAATGGGRRRMQEENSSGLRTAAVVVIVLLIGVIIGVRELIEKYQREKVVESAEIKVSPLEQAPVAPGATPPVTAASTPEAAPAVTPPADAAANVPAPTATSPAAPPTSAAPVAAPPVAVPAAAAPAPAPTPAPVAATPPPSAPPKPAEKPPEKAVEKPAAESAAPTSPVKNVKSEIILEALDKVDVKIQIKGETKKLSLAPTQVHTIRADQPVVFDFSDGGAVNIILNGREQGPAGELGKPKQLKLP